MRTRFLTSDYFSAPLTCEALRDFHVLSLPVPSFSSPDPSLGLEIPFLIPDSSAEHEIDGFPFEEALTYFLSDVIPRLHVEDERRSSDGSDRMQLAPNCESGSVELGSVELGSVELGSGTNVMECLERTVDFLCKEVEKSSESKSGIPVAKFPVTVFQFEIPEVEVLPMCESGIFSNGDETGLFFEIPRVGVTLDKLDVDLTISITCPYEVDRLLCLIEDVPVILISNQESFSSKDGNSLHDDKFHHAIKLPFFEVGEIHESSSVEETFNDLLAYLKPQKNGDGLVVNAGFFLGSSNDNISEHFSTADTFEYVLHEPMPLNSLLELDLIDLNSSILDKQSELYPVISDGNSVHLPCSAWLEEVQILDKISVNVPDMFSHFEEVEKEYFSKKMSKEDIGLMENFYELVLTSELSLADDVFKYLPAPVMHDDKTVKSQSMVMEDILNALKPHPFSVCDGIYLDWHPLVEGVCNHESCSTLISMMEEVCCYKLDTSELLSEDENLIPCDFDFMDDSFGELSILQSKELLTDVHVNNPDAMDPPVEPADTKIVKHDVEESDGAKQMPKRNSTKISSYIGSLSQSNDLNFFLGVRKGRAGVCSGFETSGTEGLISKIASRDSTQEPSEPSTSSGSNIGKIEVHEASLSNYILEFIDKIQGIYFLNLNKCKHLISNSSSPTKKDYELLSIPKGRLLELIAKKGGSQCPFGTRDEAFVALLAIYAIKQMAFYLCIFGFDIAYLYVSNLSSKVEILVNILQPFQCLLQDAHWKIEKQIIESHSSLPLIESILRSNASHGCHKTLIISDEVFWASLKQKLTILKITFHEVRAYFPANQMDNIRFEGSVLEALSHSDCLLLSYQNISASFPFNMFSNILEYGGIHATSRISEMLPCLGGFPHVHFIKVGLEKHYLAKALCEGFDASTNPVIFMEGYLSHLQGCLNNENVEGLLSQFSLDKACNNLCESAQIVEASHANECAKSVLHLPSSNKRTAKVSSVPEVVIIVNTQNIEKNMIISRRRSYQKILALEKGGVQVVERDINLPLDLIFSAAVCLVWYEAKYFLDKTQAVPECIENIATKILMSLSSSFSCCILIFEGESNFLTSIMELSDMLYAAAASLDLNLQLFCSHMAETTEDIILNCIRTTSITDTGLYSAMPESETIAESFLTKFPSLNPLSAHAILSSGGLLVEFLEWSQESRIQALGKYKIPTESISLFNALCRYGELGESTSVMTDCSSIDSDISGRTLQFKRKRQRRGISSCQPGMLMDDSIYVEPSQSNYSSSVMSHSFHSYHSNNARFNDVLERAQFLRNAEITDKKQDVNFSKVSSFDENAYIRHSYPRDKFSNVVVDYSCGFSDEQCASIPRSGFNIRGPKLRSEPIIGAFLSKSGDHPSTFPKVSEINRAEDDWTSFSQKSGLHKETGRPKITFFNKELPARKNELLHENQTYALGLLNRENTPYLGELHCPHEIQSPEQQKCQKYTREFFGPTNSKNRMHQSTQNTCLSYPGSSKKKVAYQKRSPSIIDRFMYKGGGKQVKERVNKWKRLAVAQPSPRALDKKNSTLIIPSWTPIDKRARQLLSFTRTGNQKQSRLVWRRSESPRVGCSLRKRQRDEI